MFFIPSIVGVVLDAVAATEQNSSGDTTVNGQAVDAKGWRCCWDYVLGGNGSSKYCSKTT